MDVKDLLESLDYSKENVHRQALVYSFSNIFTLSMLSGFGVEYNISDDLIDDFKKKLYTEAIKDTDDDQKTYKQDLTSDDSLYFVKDLSPIKAIYSGIKLDSSFNDTIKDDINMGIDLKDGNLQKELSPKNQGLLILNEVNLSQFLYTRGLIKGNDESSYSEKLIGMILLDSAVNQGVFCQNELKNSEGFFIKKESITLDINNTELQETDKKIDWEDQVYMLWAYAKLYETLGNSNHDRYFQLDKSNMFRDYAFNLLSVLKNNEYRIIELDTAKLSSLTSSIIESLNILDKDKNYMQFVLSLCDELYSRKKQNGFMIYSRQIDKAASLASHFKSMEALVDAFEYTNFDLFLNTSEEIYNNLAATWDEHINLFRLNKDTNIKYSTKSISYILKSLSKLQKITPSSKVKESIDSQLTSFFDSSINDTNLQAPLPSLSIELSMFRNSNNQTSVIENILDNNRSYVIEKGFEINKTDYKINKYCDEFSSEHALFASDAMLNLGIEESSK
ncbi:MAG: hypothetical protein N4A68_03895 [Maledivibacter sp.]|jgi:hypothetical protein|nr:hypothetical protein [Maledivibacter sp.]